jgi:hypothetical protein
MSKPSRKRRNPRRQGTNSSIPGNDHQMPHAPAWFAALARVTPHQAEMTRTVLGLANRRDVCSICGDTPALIYDTLEAPHLPVRLCADCAEIQAAMWGTQLRLRSTADTGEA